MSTYFKHYSLGSQQGTHLMQKGLWDIHVTHTLVLFVHGMALVLAKREREGIEIAACCMPMCDMFPCMLSNGSDCGVRYDTVFTFPNKHHTYTHAVGST